MVDSIDAKQEDKIKRKRNIRNLLKDQFDVDKASLHWTQCCFYINKKKRFCNIERTPGSKYCGAHKPVDEAPSSLIQKQSRYHGIEVQRVPCPVDPSHTIYLHNLENHIKICNVTTRQNYLFQRPYYSCNCNSGPHHSGKSKSMSISAAVNAAETESETDAKLLMEKINKCFESICSHIEHLPEITPHANLNAVSNDKSPRRTDHNAIDILVLNAVAKSQSSFTRLRHAQQDVAIIRQMIKYNLLTPSFNLQDSNPALSPVSSSKSTNPDSPSVQQQQPVYVELGAGKGMLGLAVHAVCPESSIVLVERSGSRYKAERMVETSQSGRFYRANMDIRHCLISKLPGVIEEEVNSNGANTCKNPNISLSSMPVETSRNTSNTSVPSSPLLPSPSTCPPASSASVVVIAKHLCGVATDLAIRSMHAFESSGDLVNSGCTPLVLPCSAINTSRQNSNFIDASYTCSTFAQGNQCLSKRARGLAIATCCHHACNWDDYTGQDWLSGQGFNRAEFDVIKAWSGWAMTLWTSEARRPQPSSGIGLRVEARTRPDDNELDLIGTATSNNTGHRVATVNEITMGASSLQNSGQTSDVRSHPCGQRLLEIDGITIGVNEGDNSDYNEAEHDADGLRNESGKGSSTIATTVIRPPGITYEEMHLVGWRVKRILDYGRTVYLRSKLGLNVRYVPYCNEELSPENYMIVASNE